ncbi:hypothetical protein A1353_19095 [Methylomonas methanica]|uniref:ABC transporter substrate-binding protein n=1 Tax=Methylomonas methanica TaxID=421 RepID=A0A177M5B4_METMH|nr:hypothetical protein [Methylomonas methanica]OAI00916.1 hypothetical protein A1353_19095 [Methylomonas methanica]
MRKAICKVVQVGIILISSQILAKEPQVLIVYSASALENQAYPRVIEGIERVNPHAKRLEVAGDGANLQAMLDLNRPDKVIALGKGIVDSIYRTSFREQTVAGLTYFTPNDYSGVGLALDNRVLIESLSKLLPSVKRIVIVQQVHFQTIDYISSELKLSPLIEVREGADSLDTIRIIGRLLEEASATDAIFIPANLPTNILYEVAKVAWDRKVILLSTNLSHLENGALIAAYPDDVALGEQLGRAVNSSGPIYESAKGIRFALNRRVAQHLAVEFEPAALDYFSLKIK